MNRKMALFFMLLLILPFSQLMALDFSARVFDFQKKMASMGDPVAQYKLGTMYEAGTATKRNYDEALTWYKKSAAKKYKPAIRRITYVEILKNGYKKNLHKKWLQGLKQDSGQGDGEAMLLLGLMYKNGTALARDYNKAEKYMKQAVARNIAGAEDELESARLLISTEKRRRAEEQKRLAAEKQKQQLLAEARKQAELKARQRQLQKERAKQRKLALLKENQKKKSQAKKSLIKKAPAPVPAKKKKELSWAEAMALKEQREANE